MGQYKYQVEYTKLERNTYREWVEADTQEGALTKVMTGFTEDRNCIESNGVDILGVEVIEEELNKKEVVEKEVVQGKGQENLTDLLYLILSNPGMEVYPIVNNEVCKNEDYMYWLGNFGGVEVEDVCEMDERIYLRSQDEDQLLEEFEEQIFSDEYNHLEYLEGEELEDVQKRARERYEQLNWKTVIVVAIER